MVKIMQTEIRLNQNCRKCMAKIGKARISRYKWRKAIKCGTKA